jgi:hypothetical protein
MHVSRGVSGEVPLRWNCSPEISLLTLASAHRLLCDVAEVPRLAATSRK